MGVFDLLSPALDALDGLVAFLPPTLRLLLWAALASAVTMKLYQWTSRQQRMAELKAEARAAQRELAAFDGELDEMLPLVRRSLGASLRLLGLALGPAMLASLPVLFVLAWAATRFAYAPPPEGAPVEVTVDTVAGAATAPAIRWTPGTRVTPPAPDEAVWTVTWPPEDAPVRLLADDELVLSLPLDAPSPVVHQRLWWNALFGNPAGYLPDTAPVQAVHVAVPVREHLPFGPGWLRSWLTVMLTAIFAFSLLFKVLWKIH